MPQNCPPIERLEDWVAGRLGGPDSDDVAGHVGACGACQVRTGQFLSGAQRSSLTAFVRRLAASLPPEALREIDATRPAAESPERPAPESERGQDLSTLPGNPGAPGVGAMPTMADYEVLRRLGRGGMGVVYLARHRRLKRLTAVKFLSERLADEPRQLARFRAEAEVLARLRHPNVVQIFDVGEDQGRPFIAMEYVEGGPLSRFPRSGPMEAARAAAFTERIARGVHAAHLAGVVHRDLKPANVLLDGDEPKVTDFGLAKDLESEDTLTPTGAVVGTPQYMAPEQILPGRGASAPAADVYSLGALLYDLLTGQPPFTGQNVYETLDLVRKTSPVPPRKLRPEIPEELERICLRCLEKDPKRRFESAAAVAESLAAFQEGRPGKPTRRPRGRRAGLAAAATVVLFACLGVAAWIGRGGDSPVGGDRPTEETRRGSGPENVTGTDGAGKSVIEVSASGRDDERDMASAAVAASSDRSTGTDRLQAGSIWDGGFAFLPSLEGQIDGGARLEVESRDGPMFEGIYSSEEGRYAWKVRGTVEQGVVRWEFTEAVRDNDARSVVGKATVDGNLAGDRLTLTWRQPAIGEQARITLRATPAERVGP